MIRQMDECFYLFILLEQLNEGSSIQSSVISTKLCLSAIRNAHKLQKTSHILPIEIPTDSVVAEIAVDFSISVPNEWTEESEEFFINECFKTSQFSTDISSL